MKDVAEMEEMFSWKTDKILPPIMLLACEQVELIACILQSVCVAVSSSGKVGFGIRGPLKQFASLDTAGSCEYVVCIA